MTTAARYADAVPWDLLRAARERGTALSVVLDRIAPGAVDEVRGHLARDAGRPGPRDAELLVVPEVALRRPGCSPRPPWRPCGRGSTASAADAGARAALVQRTLAGALDSLGARVAGGRGRRSTSRRRRPAGCATDAARAYAAGRDEVDEAVRSGALLRGEVLARWHDVVGTGDVMRALERGVGRLRDRVRGLLTGRPAADAELRAEVESSVDAVVHAAADRAAERAAAAWRQRPAGRALLAGTSRLDAASAELLPRTREEVRAWQGEVFELVRREGAGRRATARLASLGVNGAGLTVMLAVFLQTGGLTGAEVVVAGGTSALGQRVLEAVFGDQAVRALAARAREDLMARVERLLAAEEARYGALLEPVAGSAAAAADVRRTADAVRRAR